MCVDASAQATPPLRTPHDSELRSMSETTLQEIVVPMRIDQRARDASLGTLIVVVRSYLEPAVNDVMINAIFKDSAGRNWRRHYSDTERVLNIDSVPAGRHQVYITAGLLTGVTLSVPIDAGCKNTLEVTLWPHPPEVMGPPRVLPGRHVLTRCRAGNP